MQSTSLGGDVVGDEHSLNGQSKARNVTVPLLLKHGGVADPATVGRARAFAEVGPNLSSVRIWPLSTGFGAASATFGSGIDEQWADVGRNRIEILRRRGKVGRFRPKAELACATERAQICPLKLDSAPSLSNTRPQTLPDPLSLSPRRSASASRALGGLEVGGRSGALSQRRFVPSLRCGSAPGLRAQLCLRRAPRALHMEGLGRPSIGPKS